MEPVLLKFNSYIRVFDILTQKSSATAEPNRGTRWGSDRNSLLAGRDLVPSPLVGPCVRVCMYMYICDWNNRRFSECNPYPVSSLESSVLTTTSSILSLVNWYIETHELPLRQAAYKANQTGSWVCCFAVSSAGGFQDSRMTKAMFLILAAACTVQGNAQGWGDIQSSHVR